MLACIEKLKNKVLSWLTQKEYQEDHVCTIEAARDHLMANLKTLDSSGLTERIWMWNPSHSDYTLPEYTEAQEKAFRDSLVEEEKYAKHQYEKYKVFEPSLEDTRDYWSKHPDLTQSEALIELKGLISHKARYDADKDIYYLP